MINGTPYAAHAVPLVEPDGRHVVVAIVKATYALRDDGKLVRADEQRPVRMADDVHDLENPWSSVRYPSDLCPGKVGTDVVVLGEAVADPPAVVADVAVKVREALVPLRVHGPRVYYRSATGVAVGPAARFERVPIVYELAYGGATADSALVERRNPAGRGVAKKPVDLVDRPAPQIEHPARPITSAADRPDPVGYGAISSHWQPRSDRAGTFDDRWLADRMPLMPHDFDMRHYNVANPALIFEQPLAPGDAVAVLGLAPRGVLRFEIPDVRVRVDARYDHGERLAITPGVDTVLFDVPARRVEIVMRARFVKGRGAMALREVRAELCG
jgi:hypothetical protein